MTEGKQDLERASQLSRKLKKEAAILSEWLSTTEAELVQKSTSEGVISDLDTEISWAKVSVGWVGLLHVTSVTFAWDTLAGHYLHFVLIVTFAPVHTFFPSSLIWEEHFEYTQLFVFRGFSL